MITRLRGGQQVEMRSFALTNMIPYGYTGLRSYQGFSEKAVRGIPAIHRAARLRAEALASLRLRCWRGEGPDRERADSTWQARLFADRANEYQTRFMFWETAGESLAYRNNAYIWKNVDPATSRIIEWWALHPNQVVCEGPGSYLVTVSKGYVDPVGRGEARYRVGTDTLLHIRGHGDGGTLEAPTPIEVFRDALEAPVERQRYESRMWRKGTSLRLAVQFPQNIPKEQIDVWRETWKQTYEGADGETTAVVGGGAELKPISMTASDSKFVEMANLTVDDAARIMGVPANLLGAQTAEGAIPNLEQDLAAWLRFGLGPELERVESALATDPQLFAPLGRSIYPKFDTDMFVRGDLKTEAQILAQLVQVGILTPNEARRARGLDDLPGKVGDIPQITPVGGAPNQAPAPAMNGAGP